MARALESASSINTYKQCPRKYFFSYIERKPTKPSIHLLRGKITHAVLEQFFALPDEKVKKIGDHDFRLIFQDMMLSLLKESWSQLIDEISLLVRSRDQHLFYFRETQEMIVNYCQLFSGKLGARLASQDFVAAFNDLRPVTEKRFVSRKHKVQGYIDVIEHYDDMVRLMDYKTSNKDYITDEYRLQLAIYALLYAEQHGRLPDEVGIYFLRFGEKALKADEALLELARLECELIQVNTESKAKEDYPMQQGPLCKYSTGQCDFYEHCFSNKR